MASACAADNKKDNYNSLRKKEKYIPSLKKTCPVPKCRAKMVKWIIAACEKHDQFFPATYSLATLLLDGYTDRNQVPERDMYLVAGCCLLIAAKVEEAGREPIPLPEEFERLYIPVQITYTRRQYMETEASIMQTFNWKVKLPTVASFCVLYESQLLVREDYATEQEYKNKRSYTDDILGVMIKLVLEDSSFLNKAPSKLAAAIFASARTELGVNHALWPKRLEDMFGYPLVDLLNLKTNISELYIKRQGTPGQVTFIQQEISAVKIK